MNSKIMFTLLGMGLCSLVVILSILFDWNYVYSELNYAIVAGITFILFVTSSPTKQGKNNKDGEGTRFIQLGFSMCCLYTFSVLRFGESIEYSFFNALQSPASWLSMWEIMMLGSTTLGVLLLWIMSTQKPEST